MKRKVASKQGAGKKSASREIVFCQEERKTKGRQSGLPNKNGPEKKTPSADRRRPLSVQSAR